MKLHLPKMLLTAVLAVVAMNAQGAIEGTAEATSATIAGKNYDNGIIIFGTPADASPITPETSGAYTVFTCNKSDGGKQGNGGRYKINGSSTATLNNCGDLIVASGSYTAADGTTKTFTGGQLFISNYGYSGVTTINNKVLIGETGYSEGGYQSAIRLSATDSKDKRVVFAGGITAIQDASITMDGHYNYVEGALNGKVGTRLDLNLAAWGNAQLHLSGGGNLDTFNVGSVAVLLETTKSDGTTAAASTDYTIGKLIGNNLTVNEGTTLTITKGIDGKVTNNGTLNFTGTVDVTATMSDEQIDGSVNGYSSALFSKEIATTGGTINAEGATWTFNGKAATETTLVDGTVSGITQTTKYYLNVGGDIDYTADSQLANTTETTMITVGTSAQNTKINIAGNAELQKSRLTANAATKLSGSGLYIAGSATTLGTNISLADDWTGTVQLTGGLNNKANFYNDAAKSGSTLEMKGVTGWFSNWDGTINTNFKITNNGNNAGWSIGAFASGATQNPEAVYSGTWSGEGNFYANVSGSSQNTGHMNYKYTGNISAWTGAFKSQSTADNTGSYVTLTFADNAKNVNITIHNDGGILNVVADTDATFSKKITSTTMTVNSGKTVALGSLDHAIGALTIASGATVSSTHGGTAGFINNGDVTVKAGATLNLGGGSNDVLGWSGSSVTRSVTLLGESDKIAKMNINHTADGTTTMVTNLNLNGYALIQSSNDRVMNSFGTTITATGTENAITMALQLRKHLTVNVDGSGSTLTLGAIGYQGDQHDTNVTLTKEGAGLLTISGDISGNYADNDVMAIHGDGANTVIGGATIGNVKLQNVTLSNAAHTLTGTVLMSDVTFNGSVTNNGALTLSGTVGYTGTLTEVSEALTTGNGFGEIVKKGTIIAGGSGSTTTTGVTSWNINGNDAEYNGGVVSYVSGHTDVYYVNDSSAPVNITGANQLKVQTSTTLVEGSYTLGDYVDLVSGAQMTLTGNTKLNLTNENGAKGIWMKQGAAIKLQGTSSVTVTDISIAAMGEDSAITATGSNGQIGTNATQYHQAITITNSAVTETGTLLREYNISGGKVTIDSGKTTEVKAALSDTTAVVVAEGSTAKFTVDSDILSLSGDAVEAAANLTVAGDVELNSLTIAGGKTVTLGTEESHDHTLTLQNLTVNATEEAPATVNADLVLNNGANVTMNGVLTMGCALSIGSGTVLTVDAGLGDVDAGPVALFDSVEGLTLGTTEITKMGWYDANGILASINDTDITADGQYVIGYWDGVVSVAGASVPEPATATLSLLALAGLCARRRRK